ncbi:hypothetical protein AMTR_s00097p00030300 [Amborella trichopoda]|uniref:Uncharacterized protein n=2 Tax=Amborella trichopoda TaxID=13333 RepID=W1NVR5_AMBTC|nr:hypothetical protein AMTR_s00097p00030300 [Amborella trichopoda]
MESSLLCNESFSYSWLIHHTAEPSFHALLSEDGQFFEIDLQLQQTTSSTFSDFQFPCAQALNIVPADQLIYNGYVLPLHHLQPQNLDTLNLPMTLHAHHTKSAAQPLGISFFQWCRRTSKEVLLKYFLRFLRRSLHGKRRRESNENAQETHSQSPTATESSSPWDSISPDEDDCGHWVIENSIEAAILHCKDSI